MITARFFDGQSAEAQIVTLQIEGDLLRIAAADHVWEWPIGRVSAEPGGNGGARLSYGAAGDARLVLDPEAAAALRLRAPGVFDPSRRQVAQLGLALGLIAIAGALVLGFVFGLPRLAAPIARATPPTIEARIGDTARGQLSLLGFKPCLDPAGIEAQAALQRLADEIATIARSPFPIRVEFVDASLPNAFALPGGTVVVTNGLLSIAKTPEEIAAVLGHEIAHVTRRHSMVNVIRAIGAQFVLMSVTGVSGGGGGDIVGIAAGLAGNAHSRAAEAEADRLSIAYLHEAGYDPAGLGRFFERLSAGRTALAAQDAEAGEAETTDAETVVEAKPTRSNVRKALELWSSHPLHDARVDNATSQIAQLPGRGYQPAFSEAEWTAMNAACPPSVDENGILRRLRRAFGDKTTDKDLPPPAAPAPPAQ